MKAEKKKALELIELNNAEVIKQKLETFPSSEKGEIFEFFLEELYRGNGWLSRRVGGKNDQGADVLLYHPKTPSEVSIIIQAKNQKNALSFDDTKIDLIKFEDKSSKKYKCNNFKIISINGYVQSARQLSRFNLSLGDWEDIEMLLSNYTKDASTSPSIELFSHNKQTYNHIRKKLLTDKKVCSIQATGTGKSYLIAKLVMKYFDKRIILLAPSNYILNQFKEEFPWIMERVDLVTYQKLSRSSDIKEKSYDLIILDEFHRVGAPKWQVKVEELLSLNQEAIVFGTTATSIRYLDSKRDMAKELFDNKIANTINLPEAIARGILKEPTYVTSIYNLEKDINDLSQKINNSSLSREDKESCKTKMKKSIMDWEKSSGVDTILQKYIKETEGKIIVFCENVEHLDLMELEVQKWFLRAFPKTKRKTYRVTSEASDSLHNLNDFQKSSSKNTFDLLFCINMLNEGLHIEGVNSVILLRSTVSPIIFYQQIGRAIDAGSSKKPLIIDLVNNFANIRAQNFLVDLNKEIDHEKRLRDKLGLSNRKYSFEISDYSKSINIVFKDIKKRLDSWDYYYDTLTKYREEFPNRWPVNKEKYLDGIDIGSWLSRQRGLYHREKLHKEQVEKLDSLGVNWNPSDTWNINFEYLREYLNIYGEWPSQKTEYPKGNRLGHWITTQRMKFKRNELGDDKIKSLNSIDFIWDVKMNEWLASYNLLKEYLSENSVYPKQKEKYFGVDLGTWISRQRSIKEKLSDEQRQLLNNIEFVWKIDHWEEGFKILLEYIREFGKFPSTSTKYNGFGVGSWFTRQRTNRRDGNLSNEQINKLEEINYPWVIDNDKWDLYFQSLTEFRKKYPDRWPVSKEDFNGIKIGNWVEKIRSDGKESISKEKVESLNNLNFDWSRRSDRWYVHYEALKKFRKENPDRWPMQKEHFENYPLGNFITRLRTMFRNNTLAQDKIDLLEAIDFVWNPRDQKWPNNYSLLVEYLDETGGEWPKTDTVFKGFKIGSWVETQRGLQRKKQLSDERSSLLEELHFRWTFPESDEYYIELISKFIEHNKVQPNSENRYFEDVNLFNWLLKVKKDFTTGKLSLKTEQVLADLGIKFDQFEKEKFKWEAIDDRWMNKYNLLRTFLDKKKRFPTQAEKYEGEALGSWVGTQRQFKKRKKLSKDKITLLEKIGFDFGVQKDRNNASWNEAFELYKNYIDEFNEQPGTNIIYKGFHLGQWVTRQRSLYNSNNLPIEREQILSNNQFIWNILDDTWEKNFSILKQYLDEFNDFPPQSVTYKGLKIGVWCAGQRRNKNDGKLDKEYIKKLNSLKFPWELRTVNVLENEWLDMFELLKKYRNEFPSSWPKDKELYDGKKIGIWCGNQRQRLKKEKLDLKFVQLLNEIDFPLDINEYIWTINYNALESFIKIYKRMPKQKEKHEGLGVGSWYSRNKNKKKFKEKLPRLKRLLKSN